MTSPVHPEDDLARRAQALGEPAWTQNWTLGGRELFMEIMDSATKDVWLAQRPTTPERYDALEVPGGFVKSGMGRSAHDAAFFRRSPGAAFDGPLDTMDVDGVTFSRVARPGRFEPGFEGVVVLPVYKYHRVMFAAGRTIEVADLGDGWDYVPQITEVASGVLPGGASVERVLPTGWSVREVALEHDLFVEVPYPARVCFFTSGHSFQGPVRLGL
jgi:hypothetical protein